MAKKSLKNKDFSANCKQTAEISWFRTLMPPNKHDLGAKIQILNPNAPNYLFFKINLRISNWQILKTFSESIQESKKLLLWFIQILKQKSFIIRHKWDQARFARFHKIESFLGKREKDRKWL